MIKTEPIIAVQNVKESSSWYQKLLGCKGTHGGTSFEILVDEVNNTILSLHKWGEHDHPTIRSSENAGNGLILYFLVTHLDLIWKNAKQLNATIASTPKLNTNSGRFEFSVRDLDGYYISICADKEK